LFGSFCVRARAGGDSYILSTGELVKQEFLEIRLPAEALAKVGSNFSKTSTIWEMAKSLGAALRTPQRENSGLPGPPIK